jgi:hypothetical protein
MEGFYKFVVVLGIPFAILNALGGAIAFVWLMVLGEWGIIGLGVLALVVSSFGLSIAMMPGMLFSVPAIALHNKGNRLGFYTLGFLSALYTMFVLTAWCVFAMYLLAHHADSSSLIPALLWSYGVATAPIIWLARKELRESGNEHSALTAIFVQFAYVLAILAVLLFGVSFTGVWVIFGIIMFICLLMEFKSSTRVPMNENAF